jgi:molybdopterin biosynthesis enzyme
LGQKHTGEAPVPQTTARIAPRVEDGATMNPFGSLVSADDAQDLILAKLRPVTDTITLKLEEACGYALAEDIKSSIDVPAFDRASMDGYGVCAEDLREPAMLKVVGQAFAGKPFKGSIKRGECIEIATGASIPKGCDAVVMVENVQIVGNAVQFRQPVRVGDNSQEGRDARPRPGRRHCHCGQAQGQSLSQARGPDIHHGR